MTIRSKALALFAGLAALAGTAVLAAPPAATGDSPFPEAAGGWSRDGEVRSYTAANLYEYIDGDAEKYVKAGVKRAQTADYHQGGSLDAVVDVYTMSDATGAKTIFESEAAGEAKTAPVGDAARAYRQSLVFRKGSILVRVVAYQDGADVAKTLLELAQAVEKRLGH